MDKRAVTQENCYFLKELETMPIDALKNLQFEKTKQTLVRAYHNSGFYRRRFDEAKVRPDDFKTLADIARFPFIDKQDLIKDQESNPPFAPRKSRWRTLTPFRRYSNSRPLDRRRSLGRRPFRGGGCPRQETHDI